MPLLKKKVFEKQTLPDFLRDDEEVFYCEVTNEIFRDYDEFSERMFLCNSMVWTCSMTGKAHLTYQEALESEENAKQSLREFPSEIKIPILFIASKTMRTSFGDMAEDVYSYCKDRYFIGENVEACFSSNKWKECHILSVIAPTEEQIKNTPKNGVTDRFVPPASLFKYEIEHLDAEDNDISEIMIVDCTQLKRRKIHFSRDKSKLFLKQYVEQDTKGVFVIKTSVLEDFGITKMKWDQIFAGPLPNFDSSAKLQKPVNGKKKEKQETLAKYLQRNNGSININKEKKNNLLEQLKKREEQFKIQKMLKDEEKIALRAQKRKEYKKTLSYFKVWLKPKEDLDLEDQKVLPEPTPVKSKVPEKCFGDMLMVLEFVEQFSKLLNTKDFFPGGLTLKVMERALTEHEVAGPLTDVIQMLLVAIFNVQDEESSQYRTAIGNAKDINEEDIPENLSLTEATQLATLASSWSKKHQGLPLDRLPLYSVTVSEVLRLHLLSSGARINDTGAKWRYAQRGGYTSEDDPGLHLRLHQPHILKLLSVKNVVQLSISDKLQVMSCLVNQLLTYADVRDIVEEKNVRKLKYDLKMAKWAEKKCEQEFIPNKLKLEEELKDDPKALAEALEKLEKKQIESTKTVAKLIKTINKGESLMGYDRGFRKYLRIESVPAIFVNHEDEHMGKCQNEITKQYSNLIDADKNTLKQHIFKVYHDMNTSDKENEPAKSPVKINGTHNSCLQTEEKNNCNKLFICSADPNTCILHSTTIPRIKWSFFHTSEHINQLIDALNKRGIRESELKEFLETDKDNILKIIEQTPVLDLNSSINLDEDELKDINNTKKTKDRYEDANLGYPSDMQPEDVLQNALLDNILEMEEKINAGNLGALKIKNRNDWRHCLQNKKYDKLDKTILREGENGLYVKLKKSDKGKGNSRPSSPEVPLKTELKEYHDPGRFLGTALDTDTCDSDENSDLVLLQSKTTQNVVHSLAIALVQVARAVDSKYLKKPLGHGNVSKKDRKDDKKKDYDVLDRWEQSLLASTSFSQVFLHYGTLDSCVMWSKSALLARCRICRRQKDSENMLLCDSCNLGHHLYCLKPKLTCVPKGDWFCDNCKKEKAKLEKLLSPEPKLQKKRRIFTEEDVDEEEEGDSGNEDGEEEESSEEEMDVDNVEETCEVNVELCKTCASGGDIITCEKCSSNYHIECCDPPLRRAPRGTWICHTCKQEKSADSDSGDEVVQYRRSNRRDDGRDDLPLHNAALQELLADVMKHKDAWAFLRPVQKNEVPDYFEIIKKPMDFGTIKYKLNMGEYNEDSQLMNDAIIIFENCSHYNHSEAEVYKCGVRLLKYFSKKAKELGLKVPSELEEEEHPKSKKRRTK